MFLVRLHPRHEFAKPLITHCQKSTCVIFTRPAPSSPNANIPLFGQIKGRRPPENDSSYRRFPRQIPPNTARFVLEIREGWRAPLATLTRSSSTATIHGGGDPNHLAARISHRGTLPRRLRDGLPGGYLNGPSPGTRNLSAARRGHLSDFDPDQSKAETAPTVINADSRREAVQASDPAPSISQKGLFAATHRRGISVIMPVFTRTLISFSTIP